MLREQEGVGAVVLSTVDENRVDSERFMTVGQVVDALGVTRRQLSKLPIPYYAVGASPIYARKDLEDRGLVERKTPVPEPAPITSWVYFVVYGSRVKVGSTRNVKKRFAELQCGSPVHLRLAGKMPGDRRVEMDLHERWDEHRLRGEWFRLVPEISAFIKALT